MMKRVGVLLCVLALLLAVPSAVMAGAYINKSNLSVEYLRTLNRQAATDHADIVEYNPAGTVKLDDGLTVNFSGQVQFKDYANVMPITVGGETFESNDPSAIPELYAVYKRDNWAGFFGFNVPNGGGTVNWDDGSATTVSAASALPGGYVPTNINKIRGKSYGTAIQFGGAYQFSDFFAMSIAARYLDSRKDQEAYVVPGVAAAAATIELEQRAQGWGGVIGLDFFPSENVTIGLQYQSRIQLDYENTLGPGTNAAGAGLLASPAFGGITNGSESRQDHPALFGSGVSFKLSDKFRTEVTFRYYFQRAADLGTKTFAGASAVAGQTFEIADLVSDAWEAGIAVEYMFSDTFKASLGFLHSVIGGNANAMLAEAPELDANSVAGGVAWEVIDDLNLQFAVGMATYPSDTTDEFGNIPGTTYKKNVPWVGAGIEYRFF